MSPLGGGGRPEGLMRGGGLRVSVFPPGNSVLGQHQEGTGHSRGIFREGGDLQTTAILLPPGLNLAPISFS